MHPRPLLPLRRFLLVTAFSGAASLNATAGNSDSTLRKAEAFYTAGTFDSAAAYYRVGLALGPVDADHRYKAACAFAQSGAYTDALDQLAALHHVKGYIMYPDILLEAQLAKLRSLPAWPGNVNAARLKRDAWDPASDSALRSRLDTLWMMDQAPRIALSAALTRLNPRDPRVRALGREMESADSVTVETVTGLLSTRGWMPPARIGRSGVRCIFMVLQHADTAVQLAWLPTLRAAAGRDEISPADMALFEDRTALRSGRKQRFGTQVYADGVDGKWRLQPLGDPLHVDERRRAAGLEPLADYLRNWDISWDAVEYEKSQKPEPAE